jgi:hypothetical protein
VAAFKRQAKSLTPDRILNPPQVRVRPTYIQDQRLLEAIQTYIEANGIYELKVRELRQHLLDLAQCQPVEKRAQIPSESKLSEILKQRFHLKFGQLDA